MPSSRVEVLSPRARPRLYPRPHPPHPLPRPSARSRPDTRRARTQTVEIECRLVHSAVRTSMCVGVRVESHPIHHLPTSPPRLNLPTPALIVAALAYTTAAPHRRVGGALHYVRVESPHSSLSPSSSFPSFPAAPARTVELSADCTKLTLDDATAVHAHAHAMSVHPHRVPVRHVRRVCLCVDPRVHRPSLRTAWNSFLPVRCTARHLGAGSSPISRHLFPFPSHPFRPSLQVRTYPPHVPPYLFE
ncbi:hypothetical protein B0H16DRAFT_1654026 [Mycena metata]|uniref:Uncharacterized protein n=1 Tax=Mycena metata TaxID=1033252 RepID=A0AAD7DHP5_9AGAR|nr:hypothetical protein B0H16DRAFT_1654026 [Mycena metata]